MNALRAVVGSALIFQAFSSGNDAALPTNATTSIDQLNVLPYRIVADVAPMFTLSLSYTHVVTNGSNGKQTPR